MDTDQYKNLINLLHKALGDRSWNQYAMNAGVDSGHLSRIKNGNFNKPPKPEFLQKLALKAHNGVTYEELMEAAGYFAFNTDSIVNAHNEQLNKELDNNTDPKYYAVIEKAKNKNIPPEKLDKLVDIIDALLDEK